MSNFLTVVKFLPTFTGNGVNCTHASSL